MTGILSQIHGNEVLTQDKKLKKNSATKPMNHSMMRRDMNNTHSNIGEMIENVWKKDKDTALKEMGQLHDRALKT